MKKGDTYQNFGCTWVVDDVYEVPDSELMSPDNPFGLWHKKRFKAHVVKAPEGYQGIREMDAALTGFMAEEGQRAEMIGRNGKIELVEVWKWKMGAIPKYLHWLRNMQDLGYRLTFREKGKAVLVMEDGYSYTKVMAVVVKEA